MKQRFTKLLAALALMVFMMPSMAGWGQTNDPIVLFHETFGSNPGSARVWDDSYSVKSGVEAVYSGITSYTVSNVKQGKNTTGQTLSGLNQSSQGTDAYIIFGPLNVSEYESLSVTYYWKPSSTNGTYSRKLFFATSSNGTYTEVDLVSGNVQASTFYLQTYNLPETAQVESLYLKVVYNTSNTQAIIDEFELTGTAPSSVTYSITAQSNNTEYGNVSLSGTTITASPANGYRVSTTTPYEVISGSATVTQNGNVFSVNPASDCTVRINFEAIPTYNVTLPAEDTYGTYTMNVTNPVASGTNVTLTYNPATGYDGYVATWSVNGETLEGNTFTMPDEDVTVTVSLAIEVTLDNTFFGCEAFTSWNNGLSTTYSGTQSDVTVTLDKGTSQNMYINTNGIRMYDGNSLTFTAPEGYFIISIELEGESGFSTGLEGLEGGTWTGSAAQVEITGNTNKKNMTKANIILAEIGDAVVTTITIDASGITNTDFYNNTAAGSLIATVSANGQPIEGATVTWSGNDNSVATINANTGAVTLVGAGSVTFTASYAGETGVYQPSSDTYEMTVTNSAPYVQPTEFEIGLNNTLFGTNYTGSVSGITDENPFVGSQDNVTVTYAGSGNHYVNNNQIRFYPSNKLTFEAPSGFVITKIVFTQDGNWGATISANSGTYTSSTKTWTGSASSLLFTGSGSGRCDMSKATITLAYPLHINGYGTGTGNWYLIASPVASSVTPTTNNGFVSDHYDLYRFNQDAELEWENHKIHAFNIESGHGYLYANSANTTLVFTGAPYNSNGEIPLVYVAGKDFAGWNLVGNPFTTASTIDLPYYKMNDGRTALTSKIEGGTIAAMEGVFVYAYDETTQQVISSVTFEASRSRGNSNASVNINVMHNGADIDNAIVRFDEGRQLPKYQLFKNSTKLYIPKNGKDYAIVNSEAQGEMPVNFKAEENGTYTLSVNTEEMELNYLHLIDNMTGMDVDLLQTPSYTFDATTNDYTSRFRLVFSANNVDGPSTGSEAFAFYSNGNWVVSNEGEATLQVIDVNGRIVSNETINGTVATSINATPGVYMLRLVNGNEVKTQKIVVR